MIEWKDNNFFFDHDYAPDVLWKRRKYQEAKRILILEGTRHQIPNAIPGQAKGVLF